MKMFRFHPICGSRIKFSNENRTAERLLAKTDFNNGVVFGDKKLETNVIFQVRIDKRVGLWSGSIELGVTTISPDSFTSETVPLSATELRSSTWLMASRTILQDGETLIENYGFDLEKLEEGDTVGLMRTNQGELVFFINGTSQGVASQFVPPEIYAIVNLYGKCAQVTLEDVEVSEQSTNTVEHVIHEEVCNSYSSSENNSENDKLRFHSNCGPLVKLSSHYRTAERRRPMEEFNNAVVLTHRPLRDDELFQIRIDMLVHKWSGSIEFGLTTHNPATFDFPATMTIMRNGTVIMSGNGILHDGKATNSPYTNFNLDQLQEGDRIGVMKKGNGDIHYFVNGVDQGIATAGISHQVWGAINLYGMAAKVTIVDRNEREEHNLRINVRTHHEYAQSVPVESDDHLLFHTNCGFHAAVINDGRTAHRPNARDDFNHGVVLTNRILKPNELFEVRLDKMVTKWAGSIEIGVTTHVPTQLDYPCTMTNVRSGTWMMTGNGIMHNGTSIVDEYGQSLDRLKVGDRVGVLRKENGNLHFFVNGDDQGCAATNVPESVFGVIDLYGQAAQATIIIHNNNNSGSSNYVGTNNNTDENVGMYSNSPFYAQNNMNMVMSGSDTIFSGDLKFHSLHGRNARVSNNGLTASRPNALGEFNAAIVVSSRALRDNELFEVVIERMVDRWSGNIEAGVTTIRPEELVFPNTMTDIDHDTWMLSGSSIMTGGCTVTNRYNCNLDALTVGSRVGMMRRSDGTLHYFIDSNDCGVAACEIPQNIYAVIDLYGQCAQVSITKLGDMSMISSQVVDSLSLPLANDTSHRFSICCGKNVMLKNNNLSANRVRHFTHGLIFSSTPLEYDETFEVRLTEVRNKWAGCLTIGVTTLSLTDDYPANQVPPVLSAICAETWFISGSSVRKNNSILKENYCINLNRLSVGDRVGIRICSDKCLKLYINGEDMGPAAYLYNLPRKTHVVVDLFGSTEAVTITSTVKSVLSPNEGAGNAMESSHSMIEDVSLHKEAAPAQPGPSSALMGTSTTTISSMTFDGKHGRNIELSNGNVTARRTSSYNQGVVLTSQVLQRGVLFQVRIEKLNPKWTSSIMIGVIECPPDRLTFPLTALQFKKSCWVIATDSVYQNGLKIKSKYGPNLDSLQDGHTVGIMINAQGNLHLYINGVDQGLAAKLNTSSNKCRALIDLYGQCEEVTILNGDETTKHTDEEPKLEKLEKSNEKSMKPVEGNQIKNCEYLNLCIRFKNSLCLPDPYFVLTEPVMCYCETCHKIRGDQPIYKHGDPPVDYAIPVGWVRFPVNINFDSNTCSNHSATGNIMTNSTSSLSNVLTTWHVAYHGLKISHVRRVMDFGQLYTDFGFGCEYFPKKTKGKDEKTDGAPLIFSPTVEYAAIPEFSPAKLGYTDSKTKRKMSARVAFQLLVQPGSYKRGPPSFPSPLTFPVASCSTSSSTSHQSHSTDLDLETIEWSTKEQGSTHISALLVRLDGFGGST